MTILDDSAADKRYTDWIGRKRAALKRPTLDCGCPTSGEVSYHLWCDRLACEKHAEDPHDCGEFKGKSSTESEAVPVEAVVDDDPLSGLRCDGCHRQIYAVTSWDPIAHCCLTCSSGQTLPLGTHGMAPTDPPGVLPRPAVIPTQLGPINPEVHEALRREVRRQGLTTYDIDGVTYHVDRPRMCTCPLADVTALGDDGAARTFVQVYSTDCPVCPDPFAPHADAALQPDPDEPGDAVTELPDRTGMPWTGPEQIRHACATSGGWPWCDVHRRSPWREGGCQHLHPELQYRPHTQECMVDDTGPCFCGAGDADPSVSADVKARESASPPVPWWRRKPWRRSR